MVINSGKFVSYYESPIGVLRIECDGDAITSLVKTNEKFKRTNDLSIVVKLKKNLMSILLEKEKFLICH